MPPNFAGLTKNLGLLSSEPVAIVAKSGKCFFVHSATLAAHPGLLWDQITGEPKGNKIDLSDWDDNTVGRLIQFLYVGDYQTPGSSQEGEEEESGEGDFGGRDGANTPDTIQSLADKEEPGTSDTNVLLVHAKLCVLAQRNGIVGLQAAALGRLKMALERINGHVPVALLGDIYELFGYIDSHTTPKAEVWGAVLTFAVVNVASLINLFGVEAATPGCFHAQIFLRMILRVSSMEEKLGDIEKEAQHWKKKAAALGEKVRKLEIANTNKTEELEEKTWQLEVMGTEVMKLKATNAAGMSMLEAKMQQSEVVNTEKVADLERKLQQLRASNIEEIQNIVVSALKAKGLEMTIKEKALLAKEFCKGAPELLDFVWNMGLDNQLLDTATLVNQWLRNSGYKAAGQSCKGESSSQ